MNLETIVTPADHDAGFKEFPVTHKSGRVEQVRLNGPRRRQARLIAAQIAEEDDVWPCVVACRPTIIGGDPQAAPLTEAWIDSLEPGSADQVEMVALCLAFGAGFQKKIPAMMEQWAKTALVKQSMKSTSFAPATPSLI